MKDWQVQHDYHELEDYGHLMGKVDCCLQNLYWIRTSAHHDPSCFAVNFQNMWRVT